MPSNLDSDDGHQRLALIQRLWVQLKDARQDSEEYAALMERIRREADAFRQALGPSDDAKPFVTRGPERRKSTDPDRR